MLTISKVFTSICILYLCGNREYPASFQNKSVGSSFKWLPKYIMFLAKLKGEGRRFWSGKAKIYPLNYLLHKKVAGWRGGGNVNYHKSTIYSYSSCGNRKKPRNFQKKSVSSHFSSVPSYIIFLAKLKRRKRGRPFLENARRGRHCGITPKNTWLS